MNSLLTFMFIYFLYNLNTPITVATFQHLFLPHAFVTCHQIPGSVLSGYEVAYLMSNGDSQKSSELYNVSSHRHLVADNGYASTVQDYRFIITIVFRKCITQK